MLGDVFGHLVDARGGVDRTRRWRRKPRILGQLGIARRPAETLPFGIRKGAGRDVAVAGLEHEVGPVVGIGRCGLGADHRVLHHAFRPQIRNHGIQHRDLDVIALPGFFARIERRRHRLRGEHRGGLVADDGADHLRAVGHRLRLDIGKARQALNDRIVDPLLDVGPGVADAADRDIDQARMRAGAIRPARGRAAPWCRDGNSAPARRPARPAWPELRGRPSLLMSIESERLPRFDEMNSAENSPALSMVARLRRVMSPPIGSILSTSAPWSARNMVANGPDTTPVKSSTRTPLSGPGMTFSLDCALHRERRALDRCPSTAFSTRIAARDVT